MKKKLFGLVLSAITSFGMVGFVSAQQVNGVAMIEYRYGPPVKFTGKIDKLTFKLEPEPKAAAKHWRH